MPTYKSTNKQTTWKQIGKFITKRHWRRFLNATHGKLLLPHIAVSLMRQVTVKTGNVISDLSRLMLFYPICPCFLTASFSLKPLPLRIWTGLYIIPSELLRNCSFPHSPLTSESDCGVSPPLTSSSLDTQFLLAWSFHLNYLLLNFIVVYTFGTISMENFTGLRECGWLEQ